MPEPEVFPADGVPVRSIVARVRNIRGKLLVATDSGAWELDEVGAFVFKCIDGVSTMSEIGRQIATEYGISEAEALADGAEFVADLVRFGAVTARG